MTEFENNRQLLALKRRHLREGNRRYTAALVEIPRDEWPQSLNTDSDTCRRVQVWRSNRFLVQVFEEGPHLRLSVCRTELDDTGRWRDGITWEELQQIKNSTGWNTSTAVEVYPPADQVVNVANMRHLWILQQHPPFMWGKYRQ
jgi:hypothetical protein